MRVVLVEPDIEVRRELVAVLQWFGIAVASFSDPRTAFLFMLGSAGEMDAVLVNDDPPDWPAWLRRRVEMLSAALPVVTYSGGHPDRGARVGEGVLRVDPQATVAAPSLAATRS